MVRITEGENPSVNVVLVVEWVAGGGGQGRLQLHTHKPPVSLDLLGPSLDELIAKAQRKSYLSTSADSAKTVTDHAKRFD